MTLTIKDLTALLNAHDEAIAEAFWLAHAKDVQSEIVGELRAQLTARGLEITEIGAREKALREAAEVAEANKLHWAGKVDPISAADPSRDIYRAKSAACFQVEMDILNLITATKEKVGE